MKAEEKKPTGAAYCQKELCHLLYKADIQAPQGPEVKSEPKPIGVSPDLSTVYVSDITKCTDHEIIAEIKRRGWKGSLEIITKVEL